MPHVVLLGEFNFEEVMRSFSPVFVKEKDTILKTMELFLSKEKKNLLSRLFGHTDIIRGHWREVHAFV